MGKTIDLTGGCFGYLRVVEAHASRARGGQLQWRCVCICGSSCVVRGQKLRTGATKSCGCMKSPLCAEANTTHGATAGRTRTSEHIVWAGMLSRCTNKNDKRYARYGGRGIKVCRRWHQFANFLADMGPRPPGLSLERKDNNRGYTQSNCVWATRGEQMRNTSRNVLFTVKGVTKCQLDWSKELGGTRTLIQQRLARGWSKQKAYTTKVET